MAASYSDVIFAKLCLQQQLVGGPQLQESLNAQEAGTRAGVKQSLGEVLVKRGYLSRDLYRQLDQARELAERSRHAKLSVQLLLRHGRPGEGPLRQYYEQLKRAGFPNQIGDRLREDDLLTADEVKALTAALKRAWSALYQREARELTDNLRTMAPVSNPLATRHAFQAYQAPAVAQTGMFPAAMMHTGMFQAYNPAAFNQYGQPMAPQQQPIGTGSGGFAYPMQGMPMQGMQMQMPMQMQSPAQLPPSPSPWMTAQRPAYPGHLPPQMAVTSERVVYGQPQQQQPQQNWNVTSERSSYNPNDHDAQRRKPMRKARKKTLREPDGDVPGFEVEERLGRGKVGVVWKARDLSTGQTIALKVLLPIFLEDETLRARFENEAKIAATLDHPNIRRVFSGGEAGGSLYLSMEYVDGETLQDKIDREGRLDEAEVLRWIAQIARAMDHYRRKNILHRDVKPANILIGRDRRALLCDLGISKRVYEDFAMTKQGTTLGSPWYLSPEQGMGTDDLDIRADMYSLGITLFHALSGRVPFLGGNAGVIISKHAREPLPDLKRLNPSVSAATVELVEKLCAKDREDRPRTPKALLAELQWIRSELAGGPTTPIQPLDPPDDESLEELEAMQPPQRKRGLFKRLKRWLFG